MIRCPQSLRCLKILPDGILQSVAAVSSISAANPKTSRRKSFAPVPPVKPWPKPLDPKTIISIINNQRNPDLAFRIFDYAGKYSPNFSHNYDTYDCIIQKLSQARAFRPMEVLLSELRNSRIKCSENLFVTVIVNYGVSGDIDLALKTFIRMKDFNLKHSVKSLNALLNAFVQNGKYEMAHSMFENCRRLCGVIPDVSTCNVLIKALRVKNDIEGALKVFDKMPIPNLVTYRTILGCYVSRGDMVNAKKVIKDLLGKGWLPHARIYRILINGYCQQGMLDDAMKLMKEMEVEPNVDIYEVMVEGFCQQNKASEALNMFKDMLKKDYTPSSMICCKVIDVLGEEGRVEEAYRLLKKNCAPGNAEISRLIHWLCKEGKLGKAKKSFGEFELSSNLSRVIYNELIAGMCEKGELNEARRLWTVMSEKGCKPDSFTYNAMIKGYCKVGKLREGVGILKEMLRSEFKPEKLTYSMLMWELLRMKMGEFNEVIFLAVRNGGNGVDFWDLLVKKVVTRPDIGSACLDRLLKENSQQRSVFAD